MEHVKSCESVIFPPFSVCTNLKSLFAAVAGSAAAVGPGSYFLHRGRAPGQNFVGLSVLSR